MIDWGLTPAKGPGRSGEKSGQGGETADQHQARPGHNGKPYGGPDPPVRPDFGNDGSANGAGLRTVLASLDSRQQVLVLGHAIPMPVVIQTRKYDEQLYQDLGTQLNQSQINQAIDNLF